jgi:UDPglucose 6-dehydrogenase
MKICVFGLWHLGSVTAACVAEAGFDVIGLDPDQQVIDNLNNAVPPLYEPGLPELMKAGLSSAKLHFTSSSAEAVSQADIVWVTFDTPVDDEDRADIEYVKSQVAGIFPFLSDGAVVLVSSQLPVGSIAQLERAFASVANGRNVAFACSPENLRLGKAISVFKEPERIVVGLRDQKGRGALETLLSTFCDHLIWMKTESAEMTKHAVNTFLATSVTFINEIASVCEQMGADASEVEEALRSEPRIGRKAYIRPGAAFAGGTLARDVTFLGEIATTLGLELPMIAGIIPSNQFHRGWPMRQLRLQLGSLQGQTIAILGLSYKPGTDAIRRSVAIELCRDLIQAGAKVQAFDPAVATVPSDLVGHVTLSVNVENALTQASAMVLMTEWPDFKSVSADQVLGHMAIPLVLDQNGFLADLAKDQRIRYATIGKPI